MKVFDGFVNFVNRLGLGARNSFDGVRYVKRYLTEQREQLEAMYRGNWLVGAIIDAIADDSTRAGVDFKGELLPADEALLQKHLTRKNFWKILNNGLKLSRLYGGAILFLEIEGQDSSLPLDVKSVTRGAIKNLRVYDRWQLQASSEIVFDGQNGMPESFRVLEGFGQGQVLHHSRCVRLNGASLPFVDAKQYDFFGASVLEKLESRLVYFDEATAGAAQLVGKAHLRTVSIDGLREILAAGGQAENNLLRMFEQMRYLQSNEGITLLDKNDSFSTHSYGFGGLDSMLIHLGQQLSGACGIPLVRLFGQSPAGLNSTGENDLRNYYDTINSLQESILREPLTFLFDCYFRDVFGVEPPVDFDFDFNVLWQEKKADKIAAGVAAAGIVLQAYEKGVLSQKTALLELKKQGFDNGLFTQISDEDVEAAGFELPPEIDGELDGGKL